MRTTGSQFLGFQGPTEDPAARRKLIPPGISLQSFQTLRKREVLINGPRKAGRSHQSIRNQNGLYPLNSNTGSGQGAIPSNYR